MNFRTILKPHKSEVTLSPKMRVTALGSCFADNIAGKMRESLWDCRNYGGALYNPLSIIKFIELSILAGDNNGDKIGDTKGDNERSIERDKELEKSLFEADGIWYSWLADSRISSLSRQETLKRLKEAMDGFAATLSECKVLFITFGTAWCYFLNLAKEEIANTPNNIDTNRQSESGEYLVANCHKQPAKLFTRRRLTIGEITGRWEQLFQQLHRRFPELQVIFTVSPVRHLKDGFSGNTRSKAILQLTVEQLTDRFAFCHYFPAYELLNDDLRDYRFYAADLTHPSAEAIEYIWEFFKAIYLDKEGEEMLREGEKIARLRAHRPLIENPVSLQSRQAQLANLLSAYTSKWHLYQ